jgi:hypothetical protein
MQIIERLLKLGVEGRLAPISSNVALHLKA